ncbi:MAG: lamin tail domain-containing protein [Chloroflexales bacterium]|nr:lamin tail domain-containing protein [Chloroflexales bacterium]
MQKRSLVIIGAVIALAVLLAALPAAHAQSDVRLFPETGHALGGAFRVFWEANGAVETFGYPISEELTAADGRLMQWFERARFELAEGGSQPRVELGNLGVESTRDRNFPKSPPITETADRRYIAQTQHVIKYGFKEVWETRGAERIFGYPISEEVQEVLDDGEWHAVQYFEKARFEYWPDLPPGRRVLISHLGRRLAPAGVPSPAPTGQPAAPTTAPAPPAAPAPTAAPAPAPTMAPAPQPPAPSYNDCQADPNADAAPDYPVDIVAINKDAETVTLQNVSPNPVSLDGWTMCSIRGHQRHPISGTLSPGQSHTYPGPDGYIWNNSEQDDGALYNAQGQLISYWRD